MNAWYIPILGFLSFIISASDPIRHAIWISNDANRPFRIRNAQKTYRVLAHGHILVTAENYEDLFFQEDNDDTEWPKIRFMFSTNIKRLIIESTSPQFITIGTPYRVKARS